MVSSAATVQYVHNLTLQTSAVLRLKVTLASMYTAGDSFFIKACFLKSEKIRQTFQELMGNK